MATDLRCPNCYDNLGKDKENQADAWCGTCSTAFFNPYGFIEDAEHYKEVKQKYPNKKLPKPYK
jgi:hypothetical protein